MSTSDDAYSVWAPPERGTRQPRFTRDQVAAAALKLVDEHGFESLSMRRLAQELGAGTMTLYHYVRTKQDLVALMDDAMMGEILIPDEEFPSDWREALTKIARRSFAAFRAHPWALQPRENEGYGPNAMRHFEQSLLATAPLNLPAKQRMTIIGMVDDFVFGAALRASQNPGVTEEDVADWLDSGFMAFAQQQLASGDYPELAGVLGPDLDASMRLMQEYAADDDGFELGLATLLDGIERRFLG